MASIFTKILKGEISCLKVYEDEHVFAFLDIFPVRLGHTLVVPKIEIDYFVDVPEPHYSRVFQVAQRLAPAIQKATGAKRVTTACIGLEVPHFHYHLIPINSIEEFSFARKLKPTEAELKAMQEKILSHLK